MTILATRTLTAETARLWFAGAPSAQEVDRIRAQIAGGLLRPQARLVVEKDGEVFGRLIAQEKEGVIAFWNPDFRPDRQADAMREAMRLLICQLRAARQEAELERLPLENRNGDDISDNDLWRDALRSEGFRQTSAYRMHTLPLATTPPRPTQRSLDIREISAQAEPSLAHVYRLARRQTREDRPAQLHRVVEYIEDMKRMALGRYAPAWLMAYVENAPVGYILVNLADEQDFEGSCAYVIDIACVPQHRRNGVASALLIEAERRLKAIERQTWLAAIDQANLPSIRLHASLGFTPQSDQHYFYRLGE